MQMERACLEGSQLANLIHGAEPAGAVTIRPRAVGPAVNQHGHSRQHGMPITVSKERRP
jgi:hypothetical protein